MAERNRVDLKNEFRDGERPTGADFADFIDSYLNKQDDLVTVDPNGNLDIPAGLNLKDTASGVNGSLRFNGGQVQVFDGATWNNISGGGGGAFTPVGAGPHVAFAGGNVGIGNFVAPPTFRLEVELGNNTGADQRARFGNAVLSNGQGASQTVAQFAHQAQADNNNNFALRQGPNGDVNLNAPAGQPLTISHNRVQARLFVAADGTVVIANNAILPQLNAPSVTVFQVNGFAGKTQGGATWQVPSDLRLKENITPFSDGLSKLMEVNPVRFNYKDQPGSQEEVGVIGQEIEKVFPYMITQTSGSNDLSGQNEGGLLMYNSNALTYVMVNAIQELATRIVDLEEQLHKHTQ
ncbi:MAG TPA: tail fiber domain-containing protein [Saprospiraceae bacterium]|nr:tail fiber domain-containing protein [Saprospiraceae bacterium]